MDNDLLRELIEEGEQINSEFVLPDKQELSLWVYKVEQFLKNENEYDSEAKKLIQEVKFFGFDNNARFNLISYLKIRCDFVSPPSLPQEPKAFVAMWFDHSMDLIYKDGYKPVISNNGMECHRIDEIEYNGSIMSHIEVEISKSRLFVADLTGNRGGVYYEAGIARGMMLCNHPVRLILTCKEDCFHSAAGKPHFDVAGDNIIVYSNIADLRDKLDKRIKATVNLDRN